MRAGEGIDESEIEVAAPLARLQRSSPVTEKSVHDAVYAASGGSLVTSLVTGCRLSASAHLGVPGGNLQGDTRSHSY